MNIFKTTSILMVLLTNLFLVNFSCKKSIEKKQFTSPVSIQKKIYGKTKDNKEVFQFIMKNKLGMSVSIITYGGIITSLTAKNKKNKYEDIVLGYNSLEEYESRSPYFGALIGRYGNRIAKGEFVLDGKEYILGRNNGPNHLHGGLKGFDKVIWGAKEIIKDSTASLELRYLSKDGEEGYPGNLQVKVIYTLNNRDELSVNYEANTDKATIVNLTQHTYFNLSGNFDNDILDHELKINADSFLPVDTDLIPTGEIRKVKNTPFDFSFPKKIGFDIKNEDLQLKNGKGYDHCWVLNEQEKDFRFVASVFEKKSGRLLEIFSSEPGIQFYSGNFLDGTLPTKTKGNYKFRTGFCLETQHYPDSPNQPNFPSVKLDLGEIYSSKTLFRFSTKKN